MKIWLQKCTMAVLVPIVLLLGLELILRLFGVGYSPDAFIRTTVNGQPAWTGNPFFTYRFFSPPLARIPSPILVTEEKPADALRVVVLGESAAQGDPMPAFGMPRYLEAILTRVYPDRKIEVINAAITAITTPVITEIAAELPKLQPDVVILYAGNNDVIGPFGSVTATFKAAPADWMIRTALQMSRWKIVQGLSTLQAMAAELRGPVRFVGVSRMLHRPVPADHPGLAVVRRRYERNLRDCIAKARSAGADVLLCTVAVNLADCPPTISQHRAGFTASQQAEWDHLWAKAESAWAEGRLDNALDLYQQAVLLDDQYAMAHYQVGQCRLRLGQEAEAAAPLRRAMDLDAFRYRTDSALNDRVRAIAADPAERVTLVDVDAEFRAEGLGRDRDLFVDHVHFTPEGTYRFATILADALTGLSEVASSRPAVTWPSLEQAQEECLFTPLSEQQLALNLLSRYAQPPFSEHRDIEEKIQRQHEVLERTLPLVESMDIEAMHQRYREHVQGHPEDWSAQDLWGAFLLSMNRYQDVITSIGPLSDRQPDRRRLRGVLAEAFAAGGNADDAASMLLGWSPKQGYLAAQTSLAQIDRLLSNGQEEEAAAYAAALRQRMRWVDYRWRLRAADDALHSILGPRDQALVLLEKGAFQEADALWSRLEAFRADWPLPPFVRAMLQGMQGTPSAGAAALARALSLWGPARSLYHTGLWEARFGDPQQARAAWLASARVAYDDEELARSLAWILVAHPYGEIYRDVPTALSLMERLASGSRPLAPETLDAIGAAYAAAGDFPAAIAYADQALAEAKRQGKTDLASDLVSRRDGYRKDVPARWPRTGGPMDFF